MAVLQEMTLFLFILVKTTDQHNPQEAIAIGIFLQTKTHFTIGIPLRSLRSTNLPEK